MCAATSRAAQPLLPAYLMVGTDELKQRKAIERLDARLAASGEAEFNRDALDGGSSLDANAVRSSLDTLPFGSDFRLVVIRDVDKASKAVKDMLAAYLDDPAPTTVLVMTAAKLPKNTRLYKGVAKLGDKAVIDCAPKKRWELPAQVVSMARAHGKQMDMDAAELLVRLVGESTTMLDTELVKLASAVGSGSRYPPMTSSSTWRASPRSSPGTFSRRSRSATRPLPCACSTRCPPRASSVCSRSCSRGYASSSRQRRSRVGARPGCSHRSWGSRPWQVKNHGAWARNYQMSELLGALSSAADCERALKSTPDKTLAFQRWVLSFCSPCSVTSTSSGGQSMRSR